MRPPRPYLRAPRTRLKDLDPTLQKLGFGFGYMEKKNQILPDLSVLVEIVFFIMNIGSKFSFSERSNPNLIRTNNPDHYKQKLIKIFKLFFLINVITMTSNENCAYCKYLDLLYLCIAGFSRFYSNAGSDCGS